MIYWEGRATTLDHPDDSKRLGIKTLYQDSGLINNLDIVANTFLGRELVSVLPLGLVRVLRNGEMKPQTNKSSSGSR